MTVTYHKVYSYHLDRDMEYKVYGQKGKPMLVFPTSNGRFFQYEDFGMIHAISHFIEQGKIQVWTCDGIDRETFLNNHIHPHDRIRRHDKYDKYINDELIPSILSVSKNNNKNKDQKLIVTGCSMGAFHSSNIFFRHPENIDVLIALSGVYSTNFFFGDYMDEITYFYSPIHNLSNLNDESYLSKYRNSQIIICVGQGNYEDRMIEDTRRLQNILAEKSIPAWIDYWGTDVNHDWNWWRLQISYFLHFIVS